jgi:hypothetical protein
MQRILGTVDVGCDVSKERAFARGEVKMIKRGGEGERAGDDSAKRDLARRSRTCAHQSIAERESISLFFLL